MKLTRSQFVTTVAGALAGATLRPGDLFARPVDPPKPYPLHALVGRTFRFDPADGREPIDLTLDAIVEGKASNGTRQFSLMFVAPGGESLREGTYAAEQGQKGRFQIFVVPTGRDGEGRSWFRADFNLLETTVPAER
jgi:hypothetical protein